MATSTNSDQYPAAVEIAGCFVSVGRLGGSFTIMSRDSISFSAADFPDLRDYDIRAFENNNYPRYFRKFSGEFLSKPGKTVSKFLFPRCRYTASPSTWRKSVVTARSRPS